MRVRTVKFDDTERAKLLRAVAIGRMTPEMAELLSKQPLETTPRDEDFDPMNETIWSLDMAVAWIVWRSPEAVRSAWTEFRSKCLRWRKIDNTQVIDVDFPEYGGVSNMSMDATELDWPPIPSFSPGREAVARGWRLASLEPATLTDLEAEWQLEGRQGLQHRYVEVGAAKKELWAKLSASDLVASAIHLRSGDVGDIPSKEWPHLEVLGVNATGRQVLGFCDGDERYQDVRLVRQEVLMSCGIGESDYPMGQSSIAKDTPIKSTLDLYNMKLSPQVKRICKIIIYLEESKIIDKFDRPMSIITGINKYIDEFDGIDRSKPDEKTVREARKIVWGSGDSDEPLKVVR